MRKISPEFVVIPQVIEPKLDALYLAWQARIQVAEQIFDSLESLQHKLTYIGINSSLGLSTELLDFLESFAQAHQLQASEKATGTVSKDHLTKKESADYRRTRTHFIVKSERMVAALQALYEETLRWMNKQLEVTAAQHATHQLTEQVEAIEQSVISIAGGQSIEVPSAADSSAITKVDQLLNKPLRGEQIIELHSDWLNHKRLLAKGTVILLAQSSYVVRWLQSFDSSPFQGKLLISQPAENGYIQISVMGSAADRGLVLQQLTQLLPTAPERQQEFEWERSLPLVDHRVEQTFQPVYWQEEYDEPIVLEFYAPEIQAVVEAIMSSEAYSYHVPTGSELEKAIQLFMKSQSSGMYYSEEKWFIFRPTGNVANYTIIHQHTTKPLNNHDYNCLAGMLEFILDDVADEATDDDYSIDFN
jgi:hypothetical protein